MNVAYESSQSWGPLLENVEAQQPCAGALTVGLDLVKNVAYKPTVVPLAPNVAYESHIHQGTENQHEYDYVSNRNNNLI